MYNIYKLNFLLNFLRNFKKKNKQTTTKIRKINIDRLF